MCRAHNYLEEFIARKVRFMAIKQFVIALIGTSLFSANAIAGSNDWYISAAAGASITEDADYSDATPGAASTGSLDITETGFFSMSLGYYFTDNVRVELEGSYRNPDVERSSINGAGAFNVNGEFETTGLLANAYYDFLPHSWVNPYVSAGIGGAYHDGTVTNAGLTFQGDDTVFAYQLGAGFNVALTQKLLFFTDYRYFATEDAQLGTTEVEYKAHEIRAGLSYGF